MKMRRHPFTNARGVATARPINGETCSGGEYKSRLEASAFLKWCLDPRVKQVRLQAPHIYYQTADGSFTEYTGDLEIEFQSSMMSRNLVVECKYTRDLNSKPELVEKHERLRTRFNRRGLDFIVQTEKDIFQCPLYPMQRFLWDYRNNDPHPDEAMILKGMRGLGKTSVAALVRSLRPESVLGQLELVALVWRMVATHQLCADLSLLLNLDTTLSLSPAGK